MPVIAAGVVNRQGNIILSRNFNEVSRIRIEGLLSAFPRLLESSVNKQVTYIDAGTVRYVYQPLEELFLVLITTKNSNIVEDLETLHLMGRLIPEFVDTVTEATLEAKAFRVFFAFDEVIVGGKRENTTVEQIRTYLEMDSHEELMVREEKRLQMERAKKDASRKAHEMREKRRKGMNPYSGISSEDPGYGGFGNTSAPVIVSGGGVGSAALTHQFEGVSSAFTTSSAAPAPKRAGGLTLGRAKKADITSRVLKEAGLPSPAPATAADAASSQQPSSLTAGAGGGVESKKGIHEGTVEGLHILIEEKISAHLNRDGEGGAVDVRGELSVLVSDPQLATVRLILSPMSSKFSFRAHTKVNKEMFAEDHVLSMRENKPLPVQQMVTILRWCLINSDNARPPITLSCWPSAGSITVEYELDRANDAIDALRDVRIAFPLHGTRAQEVTPSVGTWDIVNGCVVWSIPLMDAQNHPNGNVEIELADGGDGAASGSEVFFPVDVSFTSCRTVAKVQVVEVVRTETGTPVRFSQESRLFTESYTVPA
ncbi:coatomer delta subunit [Trypanosoma cruzi Dm28c]|uniref:Coatomer subunit delta n=1 Tax=Trypanosoma cruzi Dm28c TaxID=1416333 RepID=V5BI39_TRYCR|nr:coatomer delta subunit [Trypanosoma cruzi Dm28c]PBJ72065.1 coatomer delta subunit,delta-COP,delta-coat [Trypanosoma cruzi cruzi]